MKVKFILAIIFLFISIQFTLAQEKKSDSFKTKSVSIFKNGTAFFIKEGKVKTKDGSFLMTKDLPRALFGTFWIHSPNNELKHVHTYMDMVKDIHQRMVNSYIELIQANKGKKIKLFIGKDEVYEGVVEEVILKDGKGEEQKLISSTMLVFKTGSKWMTIAPATIHRVEFLEKPNQVIEKESTTNKYVLSVDFTTKKKEQPLEMMYLENGLNWIPTYLIELVSDTKAKLSLRAEVTNNAEDIENADVNFVVGIPNFRYANRYSALVDFLGTIYPNQNQYAQTFSNSISTANIQYERAETALVSGTPMGNGVTGDADEDLYFYNVKGITLKNKGRGQYPVFTKDISVAHIYETNLAQNGIHHNYYQKEFLFSPENKSPVFHSLKVENNLDFPWTTGAALVVSNKTGQTRPISQDMLKYTPIKGHSYVKLTEAPDIKITQAEKEIDRVPKKDKKLISSNTYYYYDLVTVEGKVKVKSYKDKKVDLNIKRTIIGELKKSSVKWLKAERVNRTGDFNNTTDVCWETSINGGDELEITYTYKVYVRSY